MITPLALLSVFGLAAVAGTELVLRRRRTRRVLLLGAGPYAGLVAREVALRPELHWQIVGVVEEPEKRLPPALAVIPRAGTPAQLAAIVEELRPDRILVALADRRGRLPALDLLGHQLRGVAVEEAVEAWERLTGKLAIETMQPGSQLYRDHFRCSALQDRLARGLSLLCGLIGLVGLAPFLALIALAIKLDSAGPVLFRQQRIGLDGQPFGLLKFRTMRAAVGASTEWIADNRERVTRVGELLRRLRLDELPQFLNLVRGEMNLVGPRPHPVSNFGLFSARIPYYGLRCLVRPGLTGWAQIRYRYANNLAEETEKMRYDLYYLKHRSFWLDLRIIPLTILAVVAGRGATGAPEAAVGIVAAIAEAAVTVSELPAQRREAAIRLDWIPGARVNAWPRQALAVGR